MMKRLSDYLKKTYGEKIYKLSLVSGCTCPTRDGTLGYGGCTFCSEKGSGDFAAPLVSINSQIEDAKRRIRNKTSAKRFIAYFQSYTNTYGDIQCLRKLYAEAAQREDIAVLSLATRPDCLDGDVMAMLGELAAVKPLWVELGLQTARDDIAERLHRGYPLSLFEEGYRKLTDAGIPVVAHVIFGLPGETGDDMLHTIRYLSELSPVLFGIKIHMLHVIRGTQLAAEYEKDPFPLLSLDEYADLVAESTRILPEKTVFHRMTGDAPGRLLVAPEWTRNKKKVLNTINKKLREQQDFERKKHMAAVPITKAGKDVLFYGNENAETVLIQLIGDHEDQTIGEEIACINDNTDGKEYFFCAYRVRNWNNDLSPWEAQPVFGKEGFAGRAEETLEHLVGEVLPNLPCTVSGKKIIIGGYSLSGLFALWAACRTELFTAVAAASPSVWFPGFTEYVHTHPIHAQAVYLSLGDKEEKAKNRTLASVGDAIREIAAFYEKVPGLTGTLEWNAGNHFKEAAWRTGRAFAWTMNAIE